MAGLAMALALALAGCGSRRERVFAYRLPDYPLAANRPALAGAPSRAGRDSGASGRLSRPGHRWARRSPRRRAGRRRLTGRRLNLNQVSLARLEQVPGLTPETAARIIAARAARPFRSKRALLHSGLLSPAAYAQAKGYLVVHLVHRRRPARRVR